MTDQVLDEATISELPNHYRGKVRDCYDLEGQHEGIRLIITTDRLSAFDRPIANIPEKGRVLTKTSEFWFRKTTDICPNHLIDMPDANIMICRKLDMLPVEIVVRDYLAGSTETSLLPMYRKGLRYLYGHTMPDGLRDHELLPTTIITPTTKSVDHDVPLSGWDVINQGLMSLDQWTKVCRISLDLFARGKMLTRDNGLILADTKYEFGLDADGTITLADEIHTPDSSRYWFLDHYQEALLNREAPRSFDKDVVRRWISKRCDPYREKIPTIPADVIAETTSAYINAYEAITGLFFTPYQGETPILDRIRAALHKLGILD